MSMYLLIGLFVLAVVIVIVLSFMKIIGSVLRTVLTVIFVIMLVMSVLVFFDSRAAQDQMQSESKIMLLDYDGQIVAGFRVGDGEPAVMEDISSVNALYAAKNFESIKGPNALLFVVKKQAIQSLTEIDVSGYKFSISELNSLFVSSAPKKMLEDKIMASENIQEDQRSAVTQQVTQSVGSENSFKGLIFEQTLSSFNDDEKFLVYNLKDGNLILYPESFSLKITKYTPKFLLSIIMG